jgi:uncharacterized protein (TIGR02145 family)
MIPFKAFLTGMAGVSICLANISGIVTDRGTTPIVGAVVQLENGGQTATTGTDGRFTLVVSNAVLPVKGKLQPNALSARISGNTLNITIANRAVIEVANFNLTGKSLFSARQLMNAGSHTLSLPTGCTGIFLCKVKSGIEEVVTKGISVGGESSGNAVSFQESSSNRLAKQEMRTASINDVIGATKTGYLNYKMVVTNSDTIGIEIKMIASAGIVTDADGNVYQTVKIGSQEWMAENLRVTKYNDGTVIPLVSDSAAWYSINQMTPSPAYCFYNNTSDANSIRKYGALYNWYVVNPSNPKKIAPEGWHVPSDSEWDTLQNYLIAKGYNWDSTTSGDKIAKSLAAMTDWLTYATLGTIGCGLTMNNNSGFSALPGGNRYSTGLFSLQNSYGVWWSATDHASPDAWGRGLYNSNALLYRIDDSKSCGFSVRLVRD